MDPVSGWRIVFLHGLESGPNGKKARYIVEHFATTTVICPELDMSAWDPRKANSFVRSFAASWSSGSGVVSTSLEGCVIQVERALAACKESEDATKPFKTLLMGSSWGGAVALKLIERGFFADRVLLIAPALAVNGWKGWFWPCLEVSQSIFDAVGEAHVTIVHGDADETIPVEASRTFKKRFPRIRLLEIAGGDHRLNGPLLGYWSDTANVHECSQELPSLKDLVLEVIRSD